MDGSMRVSNEKVESVQRQVASGEYRVDSERVARAMLERIGATVSNREVVSASEGGRVLLQALSAPRAA